MHATSLLFILHQRDLSRHRAISEIYLAVQLLSELIMSFLLPAAHQSEMLQRANATGATHLLLYTLYYLFNSYVLY